MAHAVFKIRRWRRVEYERLIETGFLQPGDPVEFVGGQLIVAEPQGSRHFAAVQAMEEALRRVFGQRWQVRGQGPLALDEESEPEPDVAVVPGSFRDYAAGHPSRPALVVEMYRDPVPDPATSFGWRYRSVEVLRREAVVTPLALPTTHRIRVSDLLP